MGDVHLSDAHRFFTLLQRKGILLRIYDQNVDGLSVVSTDADMVRECHGTLRKARCSKCNQPSSGFWSSVRDERIAQCLHCGGVVRPNVVFFGEGLPESFSLTQFTDLNSCDLLMVMGTSLRVYPFAGLVNGVSDLTPRVLFNNEAVGPFANKSSSSYRDVCAVGDIDARVRELVALLGWEEEFNAIPSIANVTF